MRILQVSSFHAPVGGAEVYMRQLGRELERRGHAVAYFAADPAGEQQDETHCVTRRPEFQADKALRDPDALAQLAAFAARFRPELVHLHNFYSFPVDLVRGLDALGVPLCHTVHDFGLLCPNSWNVRGDGSVCPGGAGRQCFQHDCKRNYWFDARTVLVTHMRSKLVRALADTFLAPSPFLAGLLRAHGFADVRELPYFVAREQAERAPARAPDAARSRRVLFAGRLVPEKGVEVLVRAMRTVLAREPSARLTILGDGPEAPRLGALVRELGLGGAVELAGRVAHAEMPGRLATSAVQVFPSVWCENSPLGCYEAMVAGLPMVATRIAGLPSLVVEGETGLLAEPRDPVALGTSIARVIGDPELQRRLERGCRAAAALLSADAHLVRIEAIYAELLARGHRPRRDELAGEDFGTSVDSLLQQFLRIERWALEMQAHIRHVESKGAARQALRGFGKQLLRRWRERAAEEHGRAPR